MGEGLANRTDIVWTTGGHARFGAAQVLQGSELHIGGIIQRQLDKPELGVSASRRARD